MTGVLSVSEARTDPVLPGVESANQPCAGALLRQAREASGLHIAALAVLLKVPVKKLEALESGRLDLLPDIVFVRALASSVCRTLKIDASVILSSLPQTHAPKLAQRGMGINEPFRSSGDRPGPSMWARVSQPAAVAGMLLLLGALALIFLPNIKSVLGSIKPQVRKSDTKNIGSEKAMSPAVVTDVALSGPEAPELAVLNSGLALKATTTTAAPQTLLAASSPLISDFVVFTAKTESWVEATDANGLVILRRNLAAGEVVGASGALPLKVVVGRANATQVEIRGKPFDVIAIAKDNVARFEVK